jgi:hypothetical protein
VLSAGYLPALVDLLMGPTRSEFCRQSFFELIEENYGLDDVVFAELLEGDQVKIRSEKLVKYLERLLEILEANAGEIPPVFYFREDGAPTLTMEAQISPSVRIEAGYDYCVAGSKDLRGEAAIALEGRGFTILRQSVFENAGKDLAAILRLAREAALRGKPVVLEMS